MAQESVGWPACSDRSELNGVLTCLDLAEVLAESRDTYTHIKIYCDTQAAVRFVNDPYIGQTPTWSDRRNIDLKLQIRDRVMKGRVRTVAHHVKSHQDDNVPEEELTMRFR